MTAYEKAKQTRDEQIAALLEGNSSVFSGNVKLDDANTKFRNNTKSKKDKMSELKVTTKGYTNLKADARETLTETLMDICGTGIAYAEDTDNFLMKELMGRSKWGMNRLSQEDFDSESAEIITMATENKIEMAEYGLTKEIMDAAVVQQTAYKDAKPLPAEVEAKITAINARINRLQDENDNLLRTKLGKLIPLFRKSEPELVEQFNSLNRIPNPSVSHTRVHISVQDTQGIGMDGVTITLLNGDEKIVFSSNNMGEVLERLSIGEYDVTFEKEGYTSVHLKGVIIKKGKTKKLEVKMGVLM